MPTIKEIVVEVMQEHEPWGGYHHCSCQKPDEDGWTPVLPVYWEHHLGEMVEKKVKEYEDDRSSDSTQ